MRKIKFAPGEYYHLVNRGVGKKNIFINTADYARFLFLILYCQSPVSFTNIGHHTSKFKNTNTFRISLTTETKVISNRYVELVSFCLMPNHFHLLIKEEQEGGISCYMQRIQNAYTKYFNTKNKITGHLFQGPFRAVHIEDNEQLLYLSAYIHKNCSELKGWRSKENTYPWSSLIAYNYNYHWSKLLKPEIILEQFNNLDDYMNWLKNNSAKESLTDLSNQLMDTECPLIDGVD
ncbi:MAG: transposase [bacterium]|nr:transposase [bacterium]